jgi:hypothetical protein
MFKLENAEDLKKAGKSIGAFFTRQAEEVEKNFAHHAALAEHHEAIAKVHQAEADACKTQMDELKAMAAEWAAAE